MSMMGNLPIYRGVIYLSPSRPLPHFWRMEVSWIGHEPLFKQYEVPCLLLINCGSVSTDTNDLLGELVFSCIHLIRCGVVFRKRQSSAAQLVFSNHVISSILLTRGQLVPRSRKQQESLLRLLEHKSALKPTSFFEF